MDSFLDDSFNEDEVSDFVPDEAPKPKAKAKAAAKPKKLTQTTLKTKPAAKATKKKAKADFEDEASDRDDIDDFIDSVMSTTPPNKPKPKKAPTKKAGSKPLANVANESFGGDGADDLDASEAPTQTGAADKYQKLTQLEHIIKRPDTYIGSIEKTTQQMWVYDSATESMEFREVTYVPGLYKIFDEIVVNAADNKQNDENMDEIRITVDRESGVISVWNNGRGIPIEVHSKEQIFVPELIFGHLLTSSNYDDGQMKVTGGRNGFGAKLCNVFSTEFTIETCDSRQGKKYQQTWTENMSKMGKAKITASKVDDYTKVTFKPDYKKFGMEGMDDDFEALVKRRVYDLAGTAKVAVKLNGSRIPIRNFKKYMEMYTKAIKKERGEEATNDKSEIVTASPDPRWEVGFTVSDGSFQQVSFVNSIATTSGGTHVNYIADQICNRLAEAVKKKNKQGATLKASQIRNHIFIFVNALIVNPAFTSQTKEQLTTKPSQFGSKCILDEDFYKKVLKTEVMTNILHFAEKKADQILKKTDGGRRSRMNNPKLTDANKAGTKDGHHCTLILTEGDSAKGLAMAGRAVVGPDLFGVFPLRGKLLNVRDASIDQISKNAEIQNIKSFIGLQHKKEYTDTRGLRYGHLMIMTDQDHDGSHIKGLLINFLQVQFPSLLKIPEFLIEFITPIVKVWKGDPKNPTKSKSFFTMPEYEQWKEEHKYDRTWQHKYYKGLGTSTTEDAQIYFRDLDRHLKEFHTMQDHEAQLIDLAFSKKKADERKEWLRQYKPGTFLDHSTKQITYTDFINKELILFSMADNQRSIPSVVDGLKPGQRKVLYTCFKRNVKKDMKVVELAGHVSGMTAYQHGDTSLQQTIVGLAQTFVGSNNLNCLEPSGNFGSRLQGGADCASARYIYTRLSPFARRVFHQADEPLLTYNEDDGEKIEPELYVPVVPLILINGADGIGTGWSSSIPNYNPEEVVANLKRMMDGEEPEPMQPWFRGFKGEVTQQGPDRYKFSGLIKEVSDKEVEITELPIRTWTQDFKDKLEDIIKAEKTPSFIKDYKDYNTHTKVHFVIQMDEKHLKAAVSEGLEEKFKLSRTIATSNLVAFDPEGRITKYATVSDILKEFYAVRLKYYERRKQHQLSELQKELDKFTNQARFVQMIIDGKLVISKKKKPVLIAELKEKGFKPFPKVSEAVKAGETEQVVEEDESSEEANVEVASNAYDYLLGMAIWSLTQERVEKLLRQIGEKETEIDELIKLSKEDIWRRDLDDFINEWRFQLEEEQRRERKVAGMGRRQSSKLMTAASKGPGRKRKNDDDDDDYAAPKSKKVATSKKAEAKGGLMSYLKTSPKPKKTAQQGGADDDMDLDDDFEAEVLPKKSRAAAKPKAAPKEEEEDDDDSDIEIIPKKSRAASKPPAPPKEGENDDDDDDLIEVTAAKTASKPTSKPAAKSAAAKETKGRPTAKKPVKYTVSSDSESEFGDDLLDDVSRMVKGIGDSNGKAMISEFSKPGTSAALKKSGARASKISSEFDPDETDYSKLVPQQSPRRSLLVKQKEKVIDDDDADESPKPAAKAKPAAKPKPAATTTGVKSRGGPKKDPAAVPATKKAQPAAKGRGKKKVVEDLSDDDIDAMANDILDSDGGADLDDEPVKARPSRRAATTKTKKYVIDDDSEMDDPADEDSADAFDDDDDSE
ncbi:DNA topoisomerase II [Talaromyces stipitatus ATCC 10500]|uniref:DNA topoisomerase 2 n=1 Tax=Talaromyces stipitatus (strain ATCC 10500 / CBS 375.48 / QM 6759 / NRRL 1006) TaxID=441959 RepID=B8M038_TALSN|nr:DNA topoisomerase II [Talaromyces stipitatus ATCC 10500]EED21135.1 DNA topoisomerase II [Talaromyces stipitatus ATCC 10500]